MAGFEWGGRNDRFWIGVKDLSQRAQRRNTELTEGEPGKSYLVEKREWVGRRSKRDPSTASRRRRGSPAGMTVFGWGGRDDSFWIGVKDLSQRAQRRNTELTEGRTWEKAILSKNESG
jgi:hypothetical protein